MLDKKLQQTLNHRRSEHLLRKRRVVEATENNCIQVNGHSCINFSSNDYLGLKKHPLITEAFIKSANNNGVGSGASALVSGYSKAHEETEHLFATWLGVDQAILFNSGYAANIGVISALASRSSTVFSDKLCHASLLDGILLSRAKHVRYRHNHVAHFSELAATQTPNLIVTESVFSMEGNIAPIRNLTKLAKHYQSSLLIDDGHGLGVLGDTGRGICEHAGLSQEDFSCLVLPLGKAFNAMGAIVAGRSEILEPILQLARSYCYSTALPPAISGAITATLLVIKNEPWRQDQLKKNIQFFIAYATEKGLDLLSHDETPIKPILIHENEKVLALQDFLLARGFFVSAIRPPTVPKNKARLRISLNSLHTQTQMMQLIDTLCTGLNTC